MFLKPRQPFVGLALAALFGIVGADALANDAGGFWPLAAACAAMAPLLAIWWQRSGKKILVGPVASRPISRRAALSALLATAALFFAWHAFWLSAGPGGVLASHIPPQGCVVRAVGVVDEEPSPDQRFRFRLESITLDKGSTRLAPASTVVLVEWAGDMPAYGDRAEIVGDAHRLRGPRNPGEYDSLRTHRRQGIYSEIRVRYPKDARVLDHDKGRPFIGAAYRLRHWMEKTMTLDLADSPERAALIQSMVLGSRGETLPEQKKLFQYTGTLHLFAVSGMNVAMLAAVVAWLLQAASVPRRSGALVVIPLLWIYCFATGLTPSSIRATVMATAVFGGIALDRPALAWNTLGAATFALLAWDPNQLFMPGFQLSFWMVLFLMAASKPIEAFIEKWSQPDPFLPRVFWSKALVAGCWAKRLALNSVAVSTLAWIGSMPLIIGYFHLWSPSTVPANLVAVSLAWGMMVLGLASVLAGTFSSWLAITFNNANWLLAKWLMAAITMFASIPYSHHYLAIPSLSTTPACDLEIFDLRGGGAMHLRTARAGSRDWLIDCGNGMSYSHSVSPFLRSHGINGLEGFLLSHGDSRHVGGALDLFNEMPLGEIFDSPFRDRSPSRRQFQAALETASRGKSLVWRGDTLTLAPGITLHVLFPPPPADLHPGAADDKALVLRLDVQGTTGQQATTRVLFTSDSGFLTEHWLLEHAPLEELRSDIVVKGTHAKDLSATPEFLQAVQPSLVIASGASFPAEERIDANWASALAACGIRLLRQDECGAVRITIGQDAKWQARPFINPPY
ncbi:MAG: ComEC/Rec2 family competence protein [Verrucomicrobiota bacterium]